MIKEFKAFAFKGNMVDMAVGIIIGGAFGTIVKSLVDNVFMPVLGYLTAGINFSDLYVDLNGKEEGDTFTTAKEAGEPVIGYGQFTQDLLSFLILAFVVFIMIKKVLGAMNKEEEKEVTTPPRQEALLEEIRDLLKEKA